MRPHMDNINNSFGYTSTTRPTWETARPQPPPRRRANSLQSASTIASTNMRPTRRSLFNTTVVCIFLIYHSFNDKQTIIWTSCEWIGRTQKQFHHFCNEHWTVNNERLHKRHELESIKSQHRMAFSLMFMRYPNACVGTSVEHRPQKNHCKMCFWALT